MSCRILIIDDEPDIRRLLSMTVERMGHVTQSAGDLAEAKQAIDETEFDLCLTDLKLPDGSGIEIVEYLQQKHASLPIIVITAHGSIEIAIEAMKKGAFDFINKPVDLNHLRSLIKSALSTQEHPPTESAVTEIIGESPPILQLKHKIAKVARSQAPVFIYGESGSGKELVAKAIHTLSPRREQPFIAVNCGAIPRELMESEFFGHLKGSFTGAHQDKPGLFESAEGGTLFLDEVADLPMDMQVKLLRAIQEKTLRPVGSQKEITMDVRILSATHKDLLATINKGDFRNDLYYRINVIEIDVPPLRQRKSDISLLTGALIQKIARKNQHPPVAISPGALAVLEDYEFPGNVRELENILERACALCSPTGIEAEDLQLQRSEPLAGTRANPVKGDPAASLQKTTPMREHLSESHPGADFDPGHMSIDSYLDKIEKSIILRELERNFWNRTTTAKVLGITFRSLRYRMKKLGIDDE